MEKEGEANCSADGELNTLVRAQLNEPAKTLFVHGISKDRYYEFMLSQSNYLDRDWLSSNKDL